MAGNPKTFFCIGKGIDPKPCDEIKQFAMPMKNR